MQLTIRSYVSDAMADEVFEGFDLNLFTFLSPIFPKMHVNRFDGCKTGDVVSVSLFVPLLPEQKWISEIVSHQSIPGQSHQFIDEGRTIPFFLSTWKHTHRIEQVEKDVLITDAIQFTTPWYFPAFLAYLMLYPSFNSRKKKYAKYFTRI